MITDFSDVNEETIENFNGGNGSYIVKRLESDGNRIMKGRLDPGSSIGSHKHMENCEFLYVISGTGKAYVSGKEEPVSPGTFHHCPKGNEHMLVNDGDEPLIFVAVVSRQ